MISNDDLRKILESIENGRATQEDILAYNRWCNNFQQNGKQMPDIKEISAEMLVEIQSQIAHNKKRHRLRLWTKIAAAACLICLVITGVLTNHNAQPSRQVAVFTQHSNDIEPGRNKAVLTLSNGNSIILDSAQNGLLTTQGHYNVLKSSSGQLIYQNIQGNSANIAANSDRILYNTLTVPRGGKYQIDLPDGTKVWINASSSIKYPTSFTGKERIVSITGEVYMEVAKDANHPFIVETRHGLIKVLGTHFNIMAYPNEPAVTTTLLEGSIQLSIPGTSGSVLIKPGEQASVLNNDQQIHLKQVNTSNVTAWVHDLLSLDDNSIQEFMNQLSRWYDVDIEYAGKVPDQRIGGLISRNALLSNVLAALKAAGIQTKAQGRKIIVLPQ